MKPTTAAAIALALLACQGAARADEKNELAQLLAENKNLTVQLDKAKKSEGQIAKAQLALDGWDSALKHAKEEVRRKANGLIGEGQGIQRQADATGCPWGTKQRDAAYVSSCNTEGRRLTALMEEVQRRGGSLQEVARKLEEDQTKLSEATLRVFKQKKSNNADLDALHGGLADWQKRYNAFVFNSPTYERLKKMAPAAELCPRAGSESDLSGTEACLRKLWENAR